MKAINGKLRSPKQIAELSGVNAQSIYYFLRTHALAHVRIGKKILIKEVDWESFIDRHRQEIADG